MSESPETEKKESKSSKMFRSFSKGLDKGFRATGQAFQKAGDKTFEKVSHSTWDKSDQWHADYPNEGESYDLKLRRDKPPRAGEDVNSGKFKFKMDAGSKGGYEAQGVIDYSAPGRLKLFPQWWLWARPDPSTGNLVETRFEAKEGLETPQIGNGCYLIPPEYMPMSCEQVQEREPPTFELTLRPPGLTGKGEDRTATPGVATRVEIYLAV